MTSCPVWSALCWIALGCCGMAKIEALWAPEVPEMVEAQTLTWIKMYFPLYYRHRPNMYAVEVSQQCLSLIHCWPLDVLTSHLQDWIANDQRFILDKGVIGWGVLVRNGNRWVGPSGLRYVSLWPQIYTVCAATRHSSVKQHSVIYIVACVNRLLDSQDWGFLHYFVRGAHLECVRQWCVIRKNRNLWCRITHVSSNLTRSFHGSHSGNCHTVPRCYRGTGAEVGAILSGGSVVARGLII